MIPKSVLHYGRQAPLEKLMALRAGPLSLRFDPNTGHLLQIRLGDHEVLRRIFAAVRDAAWDTVPTVLTNVKTQLEEDAFEIAFDAECRLGEVHYVWRGGIRGESNGRIRFEFDGESRSHFLRNRLGICVLHPTIEAAGKPVQVEHWDDVDEEGLLPKTISPTQPNFDIRALTYEIVPGVRAEVRFEGEVFEQEDQRNYGDDSFKTYSTPQALPKPVAVRPGDRVQQAATLTLHGLQQPILPVNVGHPPRLSITTTQAFPLPAIGLGMECHLRPLSEWALGRLRGLHLSHLRLDLNLSSERWQEALAQGAAEANALGTSLQVALTLSNNARAELRKLIQRIRLVNPKVSLWDIGHCDQSPCGPHWMMLAQEALKGISPDALFASKAKTFFHEVNNNRPASDASWMCSYPVYPQVHLTDNPTLIENINGPANTGQSAREFSSKPVVISSFTLKGRFNPGPFPAHITPNDLPPEIDPRQMSLFGAGWTLASLTQLFLTGNVHSVSCFETTGWRGVMETESGSPLPDKFPSIPGSVFPLYHLLADLGEFVGRQAHPTPASLPHEVVGLTLFDGGGRRRILVANLLEESRGVKIRTGPARGRVRILDENNAEEAMREPDKFRASPGRSIESADGELEIELLPYALATIDLERGDA